MKRLFIILIVAGSSTAYNCDEPRAPERHVTTIHPSVQSWTPLKENEKIDHYFRAEGKVFCGEVQFNSHPMEGVDTSTFQVFPGSNYAKDKNGVYYPLERICVDGANWGVCYCTKYLVGGADPVSFAYLGNEYARDKHNVYLRGHVIPGADSKTFIVLKAPQHCFFARDDKHVYMHDKIFDDADPMTFRFDEENPGTDTIINRYFFKDSLSTWEYISPFQVKRLRNSVVIRLMTTVIDHLPDEVHRLQKAACFTHITAVRL